MIPATWKKVTLGESCQIVKGKTPIMKTKPGDYPLVTMGEEHKTADQYELDAEAVCVPMISSFGHGKPGLKRVHYIKGKFALSNILTALIIKEPRELSTKFLALYLQTFKDQLIVPLQTGAANMSLRPEKLAGVPIYYPSLIEQERIVRLTEEVDTVCRLRVGTLERLTGLVPAIFLEMFGHPVTNPKGWEVKPFGELATNQDGKRKPVKASDRAERKGKYPYYGASGIIDYVDNFLFDEPALLIAEDGANLLARSTPIAFIATGKFWVNNHAHVVTENGLAGLDYLCEHFNIRNIEEYVTGSTQPKLNQSRLNRIMVPVPPLKLQSLFEERVAEVRSIEKSQSKSLNEIKKLHKTILAKAFGGAL